MVGDVIYPIVSQWYLTGFLSESDKPVIQAAYTELIGDPGERCRICESYWSDVQHTLRYHLIKVLGYEAMDNKNKYMISEDAGYIQVHGLPYVYINKGRAPEGESAKHLTDEVAERLLKENPDRSSVIVKNPNYEAPGSGAKKAATTDPAKTAAPATSKAKPAKNSKAKTEPAATTPVTNPELTELERAALLAEEQANATKGNSTADTSQSQDPTPNV